MVIDDDELSGWWIYALCDNRKNGKLVYIGCSRKPWDRFSQHTSTKFIGSDVTLFRLRRFQFQSDALRLERFLIWMLKPEKNMEPCARSEPFKWIKVRRKLGNGGMAVAQLQLRAGMMPPWRARLIWMNPRFVTNGDAVNTMTGWTLSRAYNIFGPRPV